MKYIEVKITTSETGIEPVSAALMGIGINDVEIDDPEEILGMIAAPAATEWYDETQIPEVERKAPSVKVYMDADDAGRAKAEEIRGAMERLRENLAGLMNLGSLTVETSVNDDAEWKDRWKEYFVPTRVSERIVVKPTWREYQRTGDELVIEIDPGMAFGTGTHETTSLSLRMLEKYVTPASRVLDVGTGSGILAIAAVLLGAEDVLGIDIDEDAVRVANENLALNGTADKARAIRGD
ncbi:MAG: 50S ribosomal protein L11 methyltransferase [Eubacterium sp.]|nr:50S ribosomal protein L11 methyltransferase [Eubacterium sp.]